MFNVHEFKLTLVFLLYPVSQLPNGISGIR